MDDRRLNELLETWRTEPPAVSLRDAILASAPSRASSGMALALRPRLWFAGAGLAAALAGVSCGALLSQQAMREQRDEALVAQIVADSAFATASTELSRPL